MQLLGHIQRCSRAILWKGMLDGWSFNWESMATGEGGSPRDTLHRKLPCHTSVSVLAISSRYQKTVPLSVQ
jgi:hypothetical protein